MTRGTIVRKIVNVVLFQASWFIAVLGAAKGNDWYGPLAVAVTLTVHFALIDDRFGEMVFLLMAGVLGLSFDTALSAAGVVTPRGHILPQPFSQPWMVCLWLNYAATINVSLEWLKRRYVLAAIFGAVGGTCAYYSGARLGATLSVPDVSGIVVLAVGWGVMNPILVWLAVRLYGRKNST